MMNRLSFLTVSLLILVVSVFAAAASPYPSEASDKPVVPNLTMNTIDGQEWSLHSNRGSVVLLNFWGTWCEPCRAETPLLVKIAGEYADRGVKVFGVSLDEGETELVRKFVTEYRVGYPILMPPAGSPLFGMDEVPTTLLIDAEGRLQEKYVGAVPENILRADIERVAKPAVPTPDTQTR